VSSVAHAVVESLERVQRHFEKLERHPYLDSTVPNAGRGFGRTVHAHRNAPRPLTRSGIAGVGGGFDGDAVTV